MKIFSIKLIKFPLQLVKQIKLQKFKVLNIFLIIYTNKVYLKIVKNLRLDLKFISDGTKVAKKSFG